MQGSSAVAPWHMWGSTASVPITPAAPGVAFGSTQLFRINYKRPETWSFFFAAQVSGNGVSAGGMTIRVDIDLIFGVGRAVFDTANPAGRAQFASFIWQVAVGANLNTLDKKWTTVGSRVALNDNDATDTIRPEWIVAEQIQASSRVAVTSFVPEPNLVISVSGWMAPRVHIRPEWFDDDNLFRGNETGGT